LVSSYTATGLTARSPEILTKRVSGKRAQMRCHRHPLEVVLEASRLAWTLRFGSPHPRLVSLLEDDRRWSEVVEGTQSFFFCRLGWLTHDAGVGVSTDAEGRQVTTIGWAVVGGDPVQMARPGTCVSPKCREQPI
jgi:hypothetical protein